MMHLGRNGKIALISVTVLRVFYVTESEQMPPNAALTVS